VHLTAVIFDWAGTVVDHGSHAPVATLQDVFARAGVPITTAEARLSMGIAKRAHIESILELPRVSAAFAALTTGAGIDELYAAFIPRQMACLETHSDVIAGVPGAVDELRRRGLKIGSTTGYTRPMLEVLMLLAGKQGFSPDCALCPDDVPGGGRPAPWMCYLNAIRMQVGPLWTMVKIGDTPSDIAEGRNAGMWTIGITRTGNEVGLTAAAWEATPPLLRAELLQAAAARLSQAGAHYLSESAAECLAKVDEIEGRLARGERP
jgi:phosphonoacetaldehyde hydrolase